MCLVALVYQQIEGVPIFVAANREESYARAASGPQILEGTPIILCGLDQQAGGTWLGINQFGLLIAVTNRPKRTQPASPRSRGLLCRDALRCDRAAQAAELLTSELQKDRYQGCNFLCADAHDAYAIHAAEELETQPLEPGLHVLTASNVNDPNDPRTVRARAWMQQSRAVDLTDWIDVAVQLCRDHGSLAEEPALCLHRNQSGTVSSSLIALSASAEQQMYRHSSGPPCQTPYEVYDGLARQCLCEKSLSVCQPHGRNPRTLKG